MDDDLDTPSSHGSLIKWPFYVANALILGTIVSHLLNRRDAPLDNWEVATCIFAVALSAMLFFVPHLVEYFIAISLPEKNASSGDHGLLEKTYLELKGLKEDLSDFGVKLEKIPSVVESIAKDSLAGNGDSGLLAKLEDELGSIRSQLEQATATTPPEPDPRVAEIITSVAALEKTIDRIADDLADRPQPEPEDDEDDEDDEEPEGDDDEGDEEDGELEDNLAKVDRILEETQSTDLEEVDEGKKDDDQQPEDDEEPEDENQTDELDLGATVDDDEDLTEEEEEEEEEEPQDEDGETEPEEPDDEDDQDDAPEDEKEPEDELGEESDDESVGSIAEPAGVLKGVSQFDVVVAKILPGIGNKVHVRGEGPGLSWDEGIPMSFLEIGKWGWSPTDKSAPIVVQLYKNDEEPDGNGKVELEPGEKVEITPNFSA